ncbi:MAG TPA: hypothetical protein VJ652_02020 [Noviherbaspirillum sp.]|nr:hypothetical protein [Noviherbaspirillum sp.]
MADASCWQWMTGKPAYGDTGSDDELASVFGWLSAGRILLVLHQNNFPET